MFQIEFTGKFDQAVYLLGYCTSFILLKIKQSYVTSRTLKKHFWFPKEPGYSTMPKELMIQV